MGGELFKTLKCDKCGRVICGNSPNFVTAGYNKHMKWHLRIEKESQISEGILKDK